MPSGAKKRKAARKKQGIQFNNKPSSSSVLGGDVKNEEGSGEKVAVDVEVGNVVKVERGFDEKGKSYDGGSSESSHSRSSSSGSGSGYESHGNKDSPLAVEKPPVLDSVTIEASLSETPAEDIHTAVIEESGVSVVETPVVETPAVYLVSEGNDEKSVSSDEGKVGTSAGLVDAAGSETKEGRVHEDKLVSSNNAPPLTGRNGAEKEKDHGLTQPLLAPAPSPVQTTSWKNCCGLFELFSGSGR